MYKKKSFLSPFEAVLRCVGGISGKHKKRYAYPSQKTILRLIYEWSGVKICIRTLNYVLRWLEDEGYFERVRRHREGPDGKMLFATTLYKLKKKAFKFLGSFKKWVEKVYPALRMQDFAEYRTIKQNEIFKHVTRNVENLLNPLIEGKPSPGLP